MKIFVKSGQTEVFFIVFLSFYSLISYMYVNVCMCVYIYIIKKGGSKSWTREDNVIQIKYKISVFAWVLFLVSSINFTLTLNLLVIFFGDISDFNLII